MANKSGIHIKPENKGKLHSELGVPQNKKLTSEEIDRGLHSKNPAERKRANFARNARHWSHSR